MYIQSNLDYLAVHISTNSDFSIINWMTNIESHGFKKDKRNLSEIMSRIENRLQVQIQIWFRSDKVWKNL